MLCLLYYADNYTYRTNFKKAKMTINSLLIDDILKTSAFVFLCFVLFLIAKWSKELTTSFKINDELVKKDNLSVSLVMSGYYFAVAAIFVGAMFGPSYGFIKDLVLVSGYSFMGIFLLNASRFVNDKIILRKFCNSNQLTKESNVAVGAVQFGTYVATGLIAAGAISGTGGNFITAIVFFILGQISLLAFTFLYDLFTPYSIHEELGKKNTSAGVALGGTLIALGIIVLNGVVGDFSTWSQSLIEFATINIVAFAFLPIIRILLDKLIITGSNLNKEIVEDRNIGAGLLEATIAISFAVILKILL